MFAIYTASKMSKYGVFTVLRPNTGKHRPQKIFTLYFSRNVQNKPRLLFLHSFKRQTRYFFLNHNIYEVAASRGCVKSGSISVFIIADSYSNFSHLYSSLQTSLFLTSTFNEVIDVVLVFLVLSLNVFSTFSRCFYC